MPEDAAKTRILIADDQAMFAHLLKTVLETRTDSFEVIGIAKNGLEALVLVDELKPDVLLLDLSMPELDGVQTAKALCARNDPVRVIVLTTFDDQEPMNEVLSLGVGGYILKDCEPEVLFASILAVSKGGTSLSPSVLKKIVQGSPAKPAGTTPAPATIPTVSALADSCASQTLNRREQEIFRMVAEGLDNKEIAIKLFVAEQTVKNNISSLYEKFGVHDRAKLVKIAESYNAKN